MRNSGHPGSSFWTSVAVRIVLIFLAGLAVILFFRDVVAPALKEDAVRAHREQQPVP